MSNLLMTNNVYGAKVGNLTVFTRDGAIEAYKKFVKVCNTNLTMESSSVLSDVSADMNKIGFTYEELESIEIEVLKIL